MFILYVVLNKSSLRSRCAVSKESHELINNTADVNNRSPVIRELVQANSCHASGFTTICFTQVLDLWLSVHMHLSEYFCMTEISFISHH